MSRNPTTNSVSRRSVLLGGAGAIGATALGSSSIAWATSSQGAGLARRQQYFNLGVASGDPTKDGVVLWTRLAPDPTAENGLGGMPKDKVVPVQWQIAKDKSFNNIVDKGTVDAVSDSAHSVHVEVGNLDPGAEYFYRFLADGTESPVGQTCTTPAPGAMDELLMCFASCAHWEHGYFTAYRAIAEDKPNLILHLGDYQYEGHRHAGDPPNGKWLSDRAHPEKESITLAQYRMRHALYKTDSNLQNAHAVAPWIVVFDDHEVENNWAGTHPEKDSETPEGKKFLQRRAAAFKAYYENMPLRASSSPSGHDIQLFRRFQWGALATLHMMDTRQYRSDQCEDSDEGCELDDPKRTMTGNKQEHWLLDGFNNSKARWDVLGQQVFFARQDKKRGKGTDYNTDAWDGYTASRDRIAKAMGDSPVRNGVVLTGDVHRHWASEIKEDYSKSDSKNVGVELVTTSVSSSGNGDPDAKNKDVLAENPHIKYYKNLRGYVRAKFTPTQLRADFRTLANVTKKDTKAKTDTTFLVADGKPALKEG